MIKTYTVRQMRYLEEDHMAQNHIPEIGLYRMTAQKLFEYIAGSCECRREVTILCGIGNNGADGFALASVLRAAGYTVTCCITPHEEPRTAAARQLWQEFKSDGGTVLRHYAAMRRCMDRSDLIIDAICGTGFLGDWQEKAFYSELIDFANREKKTLRLAIDAPTGINCESGECVKRVFRADRTLVLTAHRIGLFSYPARAFCGDIELIETGVTVPPIGRHIFAFLPDEDYVKKTFPSYGTESNKGDHGKLLAVVGCGLMPGAAVMSIGMALRSGVGLVVAASEKRALNIIARHHAEPILQTFDAGKEKSVNKLKETVEGCTGLLIGCGLGQSEEKRKIVLWLIENAACQIVLDADGINLIRGHIDVLKEAKRPPILTPHPGEFSRLTGIPTAHIQQQRLRLAREFAMQNNCILVLKGAGTVTVSPEGVVCVNTSGTCGLAKGGSGDVLAGLIAGIAAQPGVDAFNAAVTGVYLHGRGAEITAKKYGTRCMLPTDALKDIATLLPS